MVEGAVGCREDVGSVELSARSNAAAGSSARKACSTSTVGSPRRRVASRSLEDGGFLSLLHADGRDAGSLLKGRRVAIAAFSARCCDCRCCRRTSLVDILPTSRGLCG